MEPEQRRRSAIVRALSHRNYAIFEAGLLPTYLSSWIQRVGVGWLAWEMTHSPLWLGIIAAADLAPMLLLAPLAGAWTDRLDPLPLIRMAQAVVVLQAVLLSLLAWSGLITIEALLALSLFAGCAYPLHSTARQSLIPATVPREDFAPAIALDSALFHSTRFVGPALASFIIPVWGVQGTFIAHIAGSALCLATLLVLRLPPPDRSQARSRKLLAQVSDSVIYVARHPGLSRLMILLAFASVLLRPLQDMMPGFAGEVFDGDARELAWLTSSLGIGAVIGAIWVASRNGLAGLSIVALAGFAGTALAALGFVATRHIGFGVLFCAAMGFGLNVMSTGTQALMQFATEDAMRGRVIALYLLAYRGLPAVGALLIGVVASGFGLRIAGALAGLACLVALVAMLPKRHLIAETLEKPRVDRRDSCSV